MDKSSNTHTHNYAREPSRTSGREHRLQKARRISSFLRGIKCTALSCLISTCALPLGAYPLGSALICAATEQVPFVAIGVLLAGLFPNAPLPFGIHLLLCAVGLGLRLFFSLVVDKSPHPRRQSSTTAHAAFETLQDFLWGVPMEDTITDYYGGKKNTPAVHESPSSDSPEDMKSPSEPFPLFGERMIYRLLTATLLGFSVGLSLMIQGGFAVYDLLSTLLCTLLCPLFTYLLSPSFAPSGQELLSFSAPPHTSSNTYLLHRYSSATLISILSLLFLATYSAKFWDIPLISPYVSIKLSAIIAMLLTLRTTATYGTVPGVAVGIITGMAAHPLMSPAFILGAVVARLLGYVSQRMGILGGCLAGLLWVLLGGGGELAVAYLPSMLLVIPIYLTWDKFAKRFPSYAPDLSTLSLHDFSSSVSQKTRAEAHIDRLEALSGAFSSLSKLFYGLSDHLRYPKLPEIQKMCNEVFDRHCDHCPQRDICDHAAQIHPSDVLSPAIASQLFETGKVERSTLPKNSAETCIRIQHILDDIGHRCARMTEQRLRSEKTEVFATDYQAIADLIHETLTQDSEEYKCNREVADRISDYLIKQGVAVYGVVVCGKRHCHIHVRGLKFNRTPNGLSTLHQAMEDICQQKLSMPEFSHEGGHILMQMSSIPGIKTTYAGSTVPAGMSQNAPLPSPLCSEASSDKPYIPPATCGDHIAMFESENACFYALISDGMGSGDDASMTSHICVTFLEKMLSAGNSVELSIKMLNSFIRQKNSGTGEECSATVDVMALDLITGQAVFAKNGAAPTYVVRDQRVYKLKSRTLPIGILKDSEPQFLRFRMHPGDTVVMVSDGVTQGDDECPWLIDLLSDELPESSDALRLEILHAALASGAVDDLSAMVIRIEENGCQ